MSLRVLLSLFSVFFRIGAFTLGGGYAMLPLIQREVVQKTKWVGDDEFIDILAVSQSSPGAIAANAAVLVGHHVAGAPGGVVALLGVTLPSFLAILAIATVFYRYRDLPIVLAAFKAVRPAIAAMVLASAYDIGKRTLTTSKNRLVAAVALGGLLLGLHPLAVVGAFVAVGVFLGRRLARENQSGDEVK